VSVRVVLATGNAGKVRELNEILAAAVPGLPDGTVVAQRAFDVAPVVEDGTTFAANALLKARAACTASGLPAVADDSGLCVDVMGGAPGIFSARWAGRHGDDAANLQLLLAQLGDVRDEDRGAHFTCAAALVLPDGTETVAEGRMDGRLIRAPRGSGGFGYDPIFVPADQDLTAAELAPEDKNAISHRGKALRGLVPALLPLVGA
jgi:XTP/dITP diphosphohydrolase